MHTTEAAAYERHKNLKIAANEIGIPWQGGGYFGSGVMDDGMIKACLAFAGYIPDEKITLEVLRRFAGIVRARAFIECAYICETADVEHQSTTPAGAAMWCANEIRKQAA